MIKINITEISSAKCWYSQAVSLRCLFNDHKVFINDNVSWPLMVYIHPPPPSRCFIWQRMRSWCFSMKVEHGFSNSIVWVNFFIFLLWCCIAKRIWKCCSNLHPPFIKNELIQRLTKRGWVRDFVFWLIWIKSIYFALSEKNGTYYKPVSCLCRLYHKYYAFQ